MEGMWETLWYDHSIKHTLLSYSLSALQLSDAGVDPRAVSWNRSVLLHGPPGTGKTTLCKALAQKLSIQLSRRYKRGRFIEVSAHSLFSKWFSESGKLVAKLFDRIEEAVEDSDTLVFVLIDEVESLTSARKAAAAGSEPSDSIRAVNALLTKMDGLRRHPNVLILTTSNVTEAIDDAFIDRADIKAYIGPPGVQARYEILRHALHALQSVTIIQSQVEIPPFNMVDSKSLNHHHDHAIHSNGGGGGFIKAIYNGRNGDGEDDGDGGGGCGDPVPPTNLLHSLELGQHHPEGDGVVLNTTPSSFMTTNPPQETPESVGRFLLGIIVKESDGLSGRTLRKLPFLAHVVGNFHPDGKCRTMTAFLAALCVAAQKEQADRKSLVYDTSADVNGNDNGGVRKSDKTGGGGNGDHDMGRARRRNNNGNDDGGGGSHSRRSSSQGGGGSQQQPPPSTWKPLDTRSIQSK